MTYGGGEETPSIKKKVFYREYKKNLKAWKGTPSNIPYENWKMTTDPVKARIYLSKMKKEQHKKKTKVEHGKNATKRKRFLQKYVTFYTINTQQEWIREIGGDF